MQCFSVSPLSHLHDAVSSQLKYQQLLAHSRAGSARKRLTFVGPDSGSMSLASSPHAVSSPLACDVVTESPATVVHPEFSFSPVPDNVFEDEPTQLHYRRMSTSATLNRSGCSPHSLQHRRASATSASPSLRGWRSNGEEEMTMRHSRAASLSPVPGTRRQSGESSSHTCSGYYDANNSMLLCLTV